MLHMFNTAHIDLPYCLAGYDMPMLKTRWCVAALNILQRYAVLQHGKASYGLDRAGPLSVLNF